MPQRTPLPIDPIAEAKRQWTTHGWGDSATGMSAVTSIMRVQQLLLARVDSVLQPFGLSFARFELLRLLAFARGGLLPMASVVARLQVHPASVTAVVTRLVKDGFLEKKPHPDDGRAAILALTPEGRKIVERATRDLNEQVFSDPAISSEEVVDVVRVLARIRKEAGDFNDPPVLPEPL